MANYQLTHTGSQIDAAVDLANGAVQKVNGKGLSTNDYSNEEKAKLGGLENYDDSDVKSQIDNLTEDAESLRTKTVARYVFNASTPVTFTIKSYDVFLIIGFVQGAGACAVLIKITSGVVTAKDLFTGEAFESSYLSFSLNDNVFTISSTVSENSSVTILHHTV